MFNNDSVGLRLRGLSLTIVTVALFSSLSFAQEVETGAARSADFLRSLESANGSRVSQFDNYSDTFVRGWENAEPDYEDTDFGDLMYNEASTPTKLEILRLLSKETPSMLVYLQAVAMGIDIEEVLQASIKYEPERAQDLAASAVNILPALSDSASYLYSGYELQDMEREDEAEPYQVKEVIERFFENRMVLRPYPDWFEGQYHFLASAAELKQLQTPNDEVKWYRNKSSVPTEKRPVFVSLYEGTQSVLIDSEDRINKALAKDPNALLPVVFVFNKMNERSIDELGYPLTIRGIQQAFSEKGLMLTPTPEWQLGEYHIYAQVSEFYEIFDIPEEEDFEPEVWQRLLDEAEDYSVTDNSFLLVMLGSGSGEEEGSTTTAQHRMPNGTQLAVWDDPRSEAAFKYVAPEGSTAPSFKDLVDAGIIFTRTDLLAALNALGVTRVPVSFYYVESTRMRPYSKGARALLKASKGIIIGAPPPGGSGSGGGGFTPCASPPCVKQ